MMTSRKSRIKNCLWPAAVLAGLALFCVSCASKKSRHAPNTLSLRYHGFSGVVEQEPDLEAEPTKGVTVSGESILDLFCPRCTKPAKDWIDESAFALPTMHPQSTGLHLIQNWLGDNTQPLVKATELVCHDQQFLRFYVVLEDSDILTRATEDDQKLWLLGDTVEFFIKPGLAKERYYEIHILPDSLIMDARIPPRRTTRAGKMTWQERVAYYSKSKKKVTVFPEEARWAIKFCMPWEAFELKQPPDPGSIWQFAVCRYNYWSARKEPELHPRPT